LAGRLNAARQQTWSPCREERRRRPIDSGLTEQRPRIDRKHEQHLQLPERSVVERAVEQELAATHRERRLGIHDYVPGARQTELGDAGLDPAGRTARIDELADDTLGTEVAVMQPGATATSGRSAQLSTRTS
jgi:hypothetical protein